MLRTYRVVEDVTGKELSTALGLAKSTISELVKRGMPIDSAEAANLWRETHLKLRPPKPLAPQSSSVELPEPLHRATTLTPLERLTDSEQTLSQAIADWSAFSCDDQEMRQRVERKLGLLRKEHADIVKALFQAEKATLELSIRRSRLISKEDSETYTAAVVLPVITAIRNLPRLAANDDERVRLGEISELLFAQMRESSSTAALLA